MDGQRKYITIVCTGNICRSPMGEYLLRHALQAEPSPLGDFEVVSAGVSAYSGDPASRLAAKVMQKVELDLTPHRSRPLSDQLVDQSALILAMTSGHREIILDRYPDCAGRIFLFREWLDAGPRDITDPYGGSLEEYLEVRDNIVESIPSILTYLRKTYLK